MEDRIRRKANRILATRTALNPENFEVDARKLNLNIREAANGHRASIRTMKGNQETSPAWLIVEADKLEGDDYSSIIDAIVMHPSHQLHIMLNTTFRPDSPQYQELLKCAQRIVAMNVTP